MAADRPSLFYCPNCNALCHLIKVEAGPETVDRAVTCRVCGVLSESGRERSAQAFSNPGLRTPPGHAQGTATLFDILVGASWPKTCAKQLTLEFDRLKKGLFTPLKWLGARVAKLMTDKAMLEELGAYHPAA
jgi:hypothetical protein